MKYEVLNMEVTSNQKIGEINQGGNQLVFWLGLNDIGNTINVWNTKVLIPRLYSSSREKSGVVDAQELFCFGRLYVGCRATLSHYWAQSGNFGEN